MRMLYRANPFLEEGILFKGINWFHPIAANNSHLTTDCCRRLLPALLPPCPNALFRDRASDWVASSFWRISGAATVHCDDVHPSRNNRSHSSIRPQSCLQSWPLVGLTCRAGNATSAWSQRCVTAHDPFLAPPTLLLFRLPSLLDKGQQRPETDPVTWAASTSGLLEESSWLSLRFVDTMAGYPSQGTATLVGSFQQRFTGISAAPGFTLESFPLLCPAGSLPGNHTHVHSTPVLHKQTEHAQTQGRNAQT
ncbi:hypothetical protein LX36DRAFT_90975 [Colletotrichum falcatum]|nr:hypothetical protein LX36DRAFT_90975 [Colletotrichum falcatum]